MKRHTKKQFDWAAFFIGMATVFMLGANIIGNRINRNLERQVGLLEEQKIYLQEQIEILNEMQKPTEEPKEEVNLQSWKGTASYYSEDGCVGCRDDRLMANGQRFDENAMTLAFNWLPLNTEVVVKNVVNNKGVVAKVTDTGGFNELGRIADLSKGLKEAIGCTDLCEVEVIK